MEIKEFIPVIMHPEKPLEGVTYVENGEGRETLAQKIGSLREIADADYYVFHHQDLKIETPELIGPACERMRVDNVGVAGVIGTRFMSKACGWWMHQRGVVTAGAIMQGDGTGGAYCMADEPGYHPDMVAVDGCILIISREMLERYEVHDFEHYRFGYDSDICFQALRAGMKVATVDVRCRHESQGHFNQAEWAEFQKKFIGYWERYVDFPVISQSTFKEV